MRKILVQKELCTGCLSCSVACIKNHGNNVNASIYDIDLADNSNESFNFIALDKDDKPVPIFCRHCDKPECVYTCMSGAMTKNNDTGSVLYDGEKCASCYMCVMACPYGVLRVDSKNKIRILKCDFCLSNDTPKCVESCPTKAIYLDKEGSD